MTGALSGATTGAFSTSVTTPIHTNAGTIDIRTTGVNALTLSTNSLTRVTVAAATGDVTFTGGLSGITTLAIGGALSGATTGAFSAGLTCTTLGMTGALTGATTGSFSTSVTTPIHTNAGTIDIRTTGANALTLSTNTVTRVTVAASTGDVTFTGGLSGITTLAMTGALTGATTGAFSGAVTTGALTAAAAAGVSLTATGVSGSNAFNVTGGTSGQFSINTTGVPYGTSLHNNAGAVTGTTNQYICSGTYTPTLTNTTGISASTARVTQWIRIGNVVHVAGNLNVDTSGAASPVMGVSLPIASTLAAVGDLGGVCVAQPGAGLAQTVGIYADITNARAKFDWALNPGNAAPQDYSFTFSYVVL